MKPNPSIDTTKNILTISMGFLLIYLFFSYKWSILVSLTVGLIGIFSVSLSQKIETLWLKLGYILEKIVPPILLSIIYYVFLVPIAYLSKFFTKDPLMLLDSYDSYFVDVEQEISQKSFETIW